MVVGYDEGLRRKLRFGKKEVSSYIRFNMVRNHIHSNIGEILNMCLAHQNVRIKSILHGNNFM